VLSVIGKEEARDAKLDDVKDRVRDAVIREKAIVAARTKAEAVLTSLKNAADFKAAAKAAGLEVQETPQPVSRGGALPGIGASPEVDRVAFALKPGEVSNIVTTDTAVAIVKVVERQDVTEDDIKKGRTTLRDEMLADRRGRFFTSYMNKAKEKMKITIDRETLQRIVA
jgi:parvulin-like peptidyl-prolyl isomerase